LQDGRVEAREQFGGDNQEFQFRIGLVEFLDHLFLLIFGEAIEPF
jgi:hypothetical protein